MTGHPFIPIRLHVVCCANIRPDGHSMGSCGGKGSLQLVQYLRARCRESGVRDIQVTTSSCLGCCRAGPMMVVYPDRVWYAYRSEEDVDEILTKHIIGGDVVSRLALLPPPGADAAAS